MPPPAEQLATRIFLGPALRTQSDRRLVRLVREGYDGAFEEIVRRYRRPLDRFAAAIVGSRSEDVTQDAFSKALLALRGSEAEIELRPWLYRIVRNTALNDLRDRPPAAEQLTETLGGSPSAAVEAERREEIAELLGRLRALPEPQRAAIVMRELEGLSHEEIAAALGVSGGAARQAIYRARMALRDGLGMLVPLPLLRALCEHGAEAAGGGAAAAAAGAAGGAGGGAGALGSLGAAGAVKLSVATVLIAGSVGAGVAIHNGHGAGSSAPQAEAAAGLSKAEGATEAGDPGEGGQETVVADGGPSGGEGRRKRGGDGGSGPGAGLPHVRSTDTNSGPGGAGGSPGGPSRSGPPRDGGSRHDDGHGHHPGDDTLHPEETAAPGGDEHRGDHHAGGEEPSGDGEGGSGGGSDDHSGEGSGGGDQTTAQPLEAGEPQPEPVEEGDSHDGESGGSGSSGSSGTSGSSGGAAEISP